MQKQINKCKAAKLPCNSLSPPAGPSIVGMMHKGQDGKSEAKAYPLRMNRSYCFGRSWQAMVAVVVNGSIADAQPGLVLVGSADAEANPPILRETCICKTYLSPQKSGKESS